MGLERDENLCAITSPASAGTASARWLQKLKRVDLERGSQPLDRLEREVPLTPLEATHIGAMNANQVSKRFLAQSASLAAGAQIASHSPLKLAFHAFERGGSLLDDLQTYGYRCTA